MGIGASKTKKNEEPPKASDFDLEEEDEDDEDDELEKRRKEIQNRQRLEKAGKLPQIGGNRKIIGLDESDEEEISKDGKKTKKQKTKKSGNDQDDKLKKELKELEQTFKSLDEDDSRWGLNRGEKNRGGNKLETHSAFTQSNRQPMEDHHGGGYWSASPPTFQRNAPKTSRSRGGAPNFQAHQSRPTLTKTLKFSWDEQPTYPKDKDSEEWTYKQTVINGFDPEKFRRANLTRGTGIDSDIRIERRIQSPASSTVQLTPSMPGVPNYDPTERQLLASLEQELGVL